MTPLAAAVAKVAHARALLDEALRELSDATAANDSTRVPTQVKVKPRRGPRPIVRPPGESDELSAARARRILRGAGFVPRNTP